MLTASLLRQKPKEKTKNAVKKLKLTAAKKPKHVAAQSHLRRLQPKEDPITSESGGEPGVETAGAGTRAAAARDDRVRARGSRHSPPML